MIRSFNCLSRKLSPPCINVYHHLRVKLRSLFSFILLFSLTLLFFYSILSQYLIQYHVYLRSILTLLMLLSLKDTRLEII